MPYADADFFIAMLNEADRLSASANEMYSKYKGTIVTSLATVLEVLIVSKRLKMNAEEVMASALALAKVTDATNERILYAAYLIEEHNLGIFDAFHAALCGGEIISSDHVYDRIGIKRIRLE
jgi:predicted nucleic acid-binding protein